MEENQNQEVKTDEVKVEEVKTEEVKAEEVKPAEAPKAENEIKKQTVNTFNTAKEQMKNMNFKAEAETGKGLIKKLWSKPAEAIKEIVADGENKFFKTALLLLGVWMIIILIDYIIMYARSKYLSFEFGTTLKAMCMPVLGIVALTAATYVLIKYIKKSDKSFVTIITALVVAKIPLIISSLIGIIVTISSDASKLISPIEKLLAVVSTVLVYFAVKGLANDEEESSALKSFVIVEGMFYIVYFVLSFLKLYIY